MIVEQKDTYFLITREPNEPKMYSESRLWYKIQQELKKLGFDVVKKPMWRDGHMVANEEYYLRERKWSWYLRDDYFAIRSLVEPYNAGKTLHLERKRF